MYARELYGTMQEIIHSLPSSPAETDQAALFHTYTLRKLLLLLGQLADSIPHKKLDAKDVQELCQFLADRWKIIAGTNEEYTLVRFNKPNKANLACLHLAAFLEPIVKKPKFQILMSTINVLYNEATLDDLKDDSLQLHQFVVNEDRFNTVFAGLESGIEDGIIKHGSLFNGDQVKVLEAKEAEKLIAHSNEAKEYWQAIVKKVEIETKGESFGAVLTRLANQLEKGGAHGGHGGAEFNSGKDANVGISQFANWLLSLDFHQLENLLNRTAPGLTVPAPSGQNRQATFGDIWDRLARPASADYTDDIFCVELISGNIKRIVNHNPDLFNVYPKNIEEYKNPNLEVARREMEEKGIVLKKALESDRYNVTFRYGSDSARRFIRSVFTLPDLHEYVDIHYLENILRNKKIFLNIIKILNKEDHPRFLKALGHKNLHLIILQNLDVIFECFSEDEKRQFFIDLMNAKQVSFLDKSSEFIINIFWSLKHFNNPLEIIKIIEANNVYRFQAAGAEILRLVNIIPKENIYEFIAYYHDRLVSYFSSNNETVNFLHIINPDLVMNFIEAGLNSDISNLMITFLNKIDIFFLANRIINNKTTYEDIKAFFDLVCQNPKNQNIDLVIRYFDGKSGKDLISLIRAYANSKSVVDRNQFLIKMFNHLSDVEFRFFCASLVQDEILDLFNSDKQFIKILQGLDQDKRECLLRKIKDNIYLLINNKEILIEVLGIISEKAKFLLAYQLLNSPLVSSEIKEFITQSNILSTEIKSEPTQFNSILSKVIIRPDELRMLESKVTPHFFSTSPLSWEEGEVEAKSSKQIPWWEESACVQLPNGAVAVGHHLKNGRIRIVNPHTGQLIKSFSQNGQRVDGMALLPNGNIVVGSCMALKENLRIYNPETGKLVRQFSQNKDGASLILPLNNGKMVVSSSHSKKLTIFDSETGVVCQEIKLALEAQGLIQVTDDIIAIPASKVPGLSPSIFKMHLLSLNTGTIIRQFDIADIAHDCALLNNHIVISGLLGTIYIYSMDGNLLSKFNSGIHEPIVHVENGDIIVGGWSNKIKIFNPYEGVLTRTYSDKRIDKIASKVALEIIFNKFKQGQNLMVDMDKKQVNSDHESYLKFG